MEFRGRLSFSDYDSSQLRSSYHRDLATSAGRLRNARHPSPTHSQSIHDFPPSSTALFSFLRILTDKRHNPPTHAGRQRRPRLDHRSEPVVGCAGIAPPVDATPDFPDDFGWCAGPSSPTPLDREISAERWLLPCGLGGIGSGGFRPPMSASVAFASSSRKESRVRDDAAALNARAQRFATHYADVLCPHLAGFHLSDDCFVSCPLLTVLWRSDAERQCAGSQVRWEGVRRLVDLGAKRIHWDVPHTRPTWPGDSCRHR